MQGTTTRVAATDRRATLDLPEPIRDDPQVSAKVGARAGAKVHARTDTRVDARVDAYIGVGANLGDARGALDSAFDALAVLPRTELLAASSIYRSAPIDSSGPDYLNAAIKLRTGLDPYELLRHLQRIESQRGRQRPYRNAPRTLDLDLLLYDDRRIDSPALTVPHPRMHERAFVLAPLAEIDPRLKITDVGTVADLLERVALQRIDRL